MFLVCKNGGRLIHRVDFYRGKYCHFDGHMHGFKVRWMVRFSVLLAVSSLQYTRHCNCMGKQAPKIHCLLGSSVSTLTNKIIWHQTYHNIKSHSWGLKVNNLLYYMWGIFQQVKLHNLQRIFTILQSKSVVKPENAKFEKYFKIIL